jgi:hypothetical protein
MGSRTYRGLDDFSRFEVDVYLQCRWCGHRGAYGCAQVSRLFQRRNWPSAIECIGDYFRCTICAAKRPRVMPGSRDEAARVMWLGER